MKFCSFALLFAAICLAQGLNDRVFEINLWKNFELNQPFLLFSNTKHPYSISFIDRLQHQWEGQYHLSQGGICMSFSKEGQTLEVISQGSNICIVGINIGETIQISQALLQSLDYDLILTKGDQILKNNLINQQFKVSGIDKIIFRKRESSFGNNFEEQKLRLLVEEKQNFVGLLSMYKINQTYVQFGRKALSNTWSQLCVERHDNIQYIGLCYNIHEGKRHKPFFKIDIRYSALIIDRIFGVYPKTAIFLFEELIRILQDKLFYSDSQFVEIPQHISIVRGFIAAVRGEQFSLQSIQRLSSRVKSVLNGLMNQMLLSDVNNLQQQINYRQNKKLHPTLVKMLSLHWKSLSRKNALSSIYEQSFTPDYFYNNAGQRIDTCVSKFSWLTAATAEYVLLIKAFGNEDDRDALEQPVSLFKILQQVSLSDHNAKQGKYYSINNEAGLRLYAEQIGYQSFLPFVYELTNIFPDQFIGNVSTSVGLASLNLNHNKFSQKFQFRGNVHLYFSYKILLESKRRVEAGRNKRSLGHLEQLINKTRQKIISFQSKNKYYTSWTIEGVGVRQRKCLSILALLFLGEK